MGQKGNGEIGFYASFRTDENWSATNGLDYTNNRMMLDWFRKEYAGWSDLWYELFENTSTPFIPRPIYCMPFDQDWQSLPNLTLVGDAAHVMPPFAGEGVNMAMFDALELSESLSSAKHHSVHQSIVSYEKNMRTRSAIMARESLENGERMHAEDALETMLRFFRGAGNEG